MYLPVEPGRLIEVLVNRGPENRGCTVAGSLVVVQHKVIFYQIKLAVL